MGELYRGLTQRWGEHVVGREVSVDVLDQALDVLRCDRSGTRLAEAYRGLVCSDSSARTAGNSTLFSM